MNHFKCALDRISWCEIKRFKSSLSVSNSDVRIPRRIKRGPTDILRALESTVPKSIGAKHYIFRKDPYLFPTRILHERSYGLSYESGKKAAIWVYNRHADLFPKHLSVPQIDAFTPPAQYTSKFKVSEEMLMHAISIRKINDAIQIYNLLKDDISNETKQVLLELLCFYQNEDKLLNKLHFELYFSSVSEGYVSKYMKEIDELYKSLISADSPIAAAAHNTMICGLIKCLKVEEAWFLYKKCIKENIPLNVTTYNYVLSLYKNLYDNNFHQKVHNMFNILRTMSGNGIKPNIRTLNTVLYIVTRVHNEEAADITEHVIKQFKLMDVKFSLATYSHILFLLQKDGTLNVYTKLKHILAEVQNRKIFTLEDEFDYKFFPTIMSLISNFNDIKSADEIHNLLLAQDKFMLYQVTETNYFTKYLMCALSNSTSPEFFKLYTNLVPNIFLPQKFIFNEILQKCTCTTIGNLTTYLPRLWKDINMIYSTDISLKVTILCLFEIDILLLDPVLKTVLMDIAECTWNIIEMKMNSEDQGSFSIETKVMASIAYIFLHGDNIEESIRILECIIKESYMIPTMTEKQLNELFECYISKQCIRGAYLVLKCSKNLGFECVVQRATEIYNLPQLTNDDRDRLTNLIGVQMLHTSKSN